MCDGVYCDSKWFGLFCGYVIFEKIFIISNEMWVRFKVNLYRFVKFKVKYIVVKGKFSLYSRCCFRRDGNKFLFLM